MTAIVTQSAGETEALGREVGRGLKGGDVVALTGALGSGKTRFVAGVCQALGAVGHFGSPTFTLINEYPAARCTVIHADMYRIANRAQAYEVGLLEYFRPPFVCLIEWAEHVLDLLPPEHYLIAFEHCADKTERRITIRRPDEGAA
jgi:tRNA threonylcarbamoyladenosine biosynthesis protein TsaE